MHQRDVVLAAEQAHHLPAFARAHQAGIDIDAGELRPHRLVQQHRRDRGIDAARKPADHLALAYLLARARDRLALEGGHAPIAFEPRHAVGEILQKRRAVRRVHDLGMELHAVEAPLVVGDGGEGCALADAHHLESRGQLVDPVAMAHPHLLARALFPQAVEEIAIRGDFEKGAAEFAVIGGRDASPQLRAHGLLAIADAEHRHAQLEHRLRRARRLRHMHRGRPARQNHRPGAEGLEPGFVHGEGVNLAIDAAFAHPPRDELGHLAAEIEDQDLVGGWRGHGRAIILEARAWAQQPCAPSPRRRIRRCRRAPGSSAACRPDAATRRRWSRAKPRLWA